MVLERRQSYEFNNAGVILIVHVCSKTNVINMNF